MKKKIIKNLSVFYKKKENKTFILLLVIFAISSLFFITRGFVPHSSELSYVEYSVLGKDAGSVVPASCNSSPPGSHFNGDCTATCPSGVGSYDIYYDPSASSCPVPANCTSPWGTTVVHGGSVVAYQSLQVTYPTNCVSGTRSCWNGSLSGSYVNQSCKSGSITVPASCTIGDGQSTCTVTASWASANLGSPAFIDQNTSTTLASTTSGSQLVWVAYGGTTFRLTDSTNYTYDTKTVSGVCTPGTTWNNSTGKCHYDATATLSANPVNVSYGYGSTLTWSSTHATACVAGGAWSNSGTLSGSGGTGNLTFSQVYTLQCTGLGAPSPIVSATVTVAPQGTPVLTGIPSPSSSQGLPEVIVILTGQYTPNGKLDIIATNSSSCTVKRDGTLISSLPGTGGIVNISTEGNYQVVCSYTSSDGHLFSASRARWYQPVPPPPLVHLKASPVTISKGSTSVISWDITYPGSVQRPVARVCTLVATAVCTNGHSNCTATQLQGEQDVNTILSSGTTDANDTGNYDVDNFPSNIPRLISPTALNKVVHGNTTTGDTDWKAFGKRTFILNNSMDFFLNCGNGANESQGVRVLVTSSNEG